MSVMVDKCLDHLLQKMGERVKQLEEGLGTGMAKDYADYQYTCGQIKGLLFMRIEIADLKQRMETSDE